VIIMSLTTCGAGGTTTSSGPVPSNAMRDANTGSILRDANNDKPLTVS
jgi:hypothetical protein